ncbi:MAG TPA: AsmA-like C-terminal domain-containing protein [Burkholderiales bacterium]|nr:AsmA-like C-terminal domain-containing protein [Burkholderiales bacterium]
MRRVTRYGVYAIGVVALLIVAAGLILPRLFDRPAMAAELQGRLSKALDGEVRWKEFSVRVFPFPRAVVRALEIKTASATVTAEEATAALRLWPLFFGRAEISSVNAVRPVVHLTVVPAAAVPEEAQLAPAPRNPVEAYRSTMASIVEALRAFAPDTDMAIDNADILVRMEDVPPIEVKELAVRGRTSAHGVELNATAMSRYWNSMKLTGRIDYDDLASTAELHLVRIDGQAWLDWALRASGVRVALPEVDLSVRFRGDATKALTAELDGKAGSLTLTRGGERIVASPVVLKGSVTANAKEIVANVEKISVGATSLAGGGVRYAPGDGSVNADVGFEIDLAQVAGYGRQLAPEAMAQVESMGGALRGRAQLSMKGKAMLAGARIEKSDATVQVKGLPGPATLTGATVQATPKAITVERATVTLLDSKVTAGATLTDFDKALRAKGSVSGIDLGAQTIAWAWKTAALPPAAEVKPMRITVPQFTWGPKAALDLKATVQIEGGPALTADIAWSPAQLDVRRATLKDGLSDVTISAHTKGKAIDGKYRGTLDSRTIASAMRSGAIVPGGTMSGELAFNVDRAVPRNSSAEGVLKAHDLDLSWLAGKPAKLEHLDLSASGDVIRIGDATVEWAGQRASVSGDVKRTSSGPVVEAKVDSPGVLVDALLPPAPAKPAPKEDKPPAIWPLPVTGKIGVRSKFVQYQKHTVQPLSANIVLERERIALDVQEALLCGLAVPLTVELSPKGINAEAQIAAQQQKLAEAARCLAGEDVLLTGAMDLRVDVKTQGKANELLQNLSGTVIADVRNGEVRKFALIGNILSMQNVAALAQQGGPKLGAEGFPFRQLAAKGRFDKGRFLLDEGVFHSNAIGLGANGWISLTDFQSSLTVLVAPLALLDEGVRKLPLLGYVVGGALTSLPVAVSGDIRDPRVVPLGPRAITSELTGIVSRTFSLPGRVVDPDKR